LEQGQADRAKVTAEAQGNFGGVKTRDLAMFNLAIGLENTRREFAV
jgi:hypothetical protein